MSTQSVAIVKAWLAGANSQDTDRIAQFSNPNIEIVGPRGSGYGIDLLRDWLMRAGLTLESKRFFARDGRVVVEQHGVWRSVETGAFVGEADVVSRFEVQDGRVAVFERFDDLTAALERAALAETDAVQA